MPRNIRSAVVRTNGTEYNIHFFEGASFRFWDNTAKLSYTCHVHYKQSGWKYSENGAIAPTFSDANIKNIL